jgi:hypothetical protein
MGLTLPLIFLCCTWLIAARLASRATVQRELKVRHGLQTREANIWVATAYLLSAILGIFVGRVLSASTDGSKTGIATIAVVFGIWATFIVVQLLTNYDRIVENLPREPFRWVPEERRLPAPPAIQLAHEAKFGDRFVAMELMPFYWNHFYSVFIMDRMLCGAKAQFGAANIALNSRGVARSLKFDPKGYVSTCTPALYNDLDVTSPVFLTADSANFQIALSEISSIELKSSEAVKIDAGFGLGGLRQSGALVILLKSGTTRQLILLGDQDGAILKLRLDGLIRSPLLVPSETSPT